MTFDLTASPYSTSTLLAYGHQVTVLLLTDIYHTFLPINQDGRVSVVDTTTRELSTDNLHSDCVHSVKLFSRE